MEFSRQEYWSGWPFPYPGDLPDPGIESQPPALLVDSLPSEPPGKPSSALMEGQRRMLGAALPPAVNTAFLETGPVIG